MQINRRESYGGNRLSPHDPPSQADAIALANALISSLLRSGILGWRRSPIYRHRAASRPRHSLSDPSHQSENFLGGDVGHHAHAADRRPAGDVIYRSDRPQPTAEWKCERA